MLKITYIAIGSISLGLGVLGIVLPGLPSTPFFIISAALYVRSSSSLYNWLINHRIFGKYIKLYEEHKAMSVQSKMISLILMWSMISISAFVLIDNIIIKIIILSAGVIGTVVIIKLKTYKKDK